jgi:hypothetical protein
MARKRPNPYTSKLFSYTGLIPPILHNTHMTATQGTHTFATEMDSNPIAEPARYVPQAPASVTTETKSVVALAAQAATLERGEKGIYGLRIGNDDGETWQHHDSSGSRKWNN